MDIRLQVQGDIEKARESTKHIFVAELKRILIEARELRGEPPVKHPYWLPRWDWDKGTFK